MKDDLYDAIMTITGTPEWEILVESLKGDLDNYQMRARRVDDLVTLGRLQGNMETTETLIHLREIAKGSKQVANL